MALSHSALRRGVRLCQLQTYQSVLRRLRCSHGAIIATGRKGANSSLTHLPSQFHEMSVAEQERLLSPSKQLQELDLTKFRPIPPPAGNVASYYHYSRPLQELARMGVDLSFLTKIGRNVTEFIIRSDYENDLLPIISYLTEEVGMTTEQCVNAIRYNPQVLMDGIDGLLQRMVAYLRSVGFEREEVCSVLAMTPEVMTMHAKTVDKVLEHVQAFFYLTGSELRAMVVQNPRMLRMPYTQARTMATVLRRSFRLSPAQIHRCMTGAPRLLTQEVDRTAFNFLQLHQARKLPLATILAAPAALVAEPLRLEERLDFLESSGKAQFDPDRPLYTSPALLAVAADAEFVRQLPGAPVTLAEYRAFLKSR